MKKILILLSLTLISCADYSKRIETVQKKYPKCVVIPSLPSGTNQDNSYYDVIVKDTINKQMYGIIFYVFSEQKISEIDLLLYYNF
jgi:hypothetical protein